VDDLKAAYGAAVVEVDGSFSPEVNLAGFEVLLSRQNARICVVGMAGCGKGSLNEAILGTQ